MITDKLKAYSDSTSKGEKINPETQKAFIQKNKDIFLNSLLKFGLDLEFFDVARGEKGIDLLILKCLQKVSFEEVQDFKPYTPDQNKNITFILIPQYFNNYLEFNKYNEWGIKFLLPIFLKKIIEEEIKKTENQKSKDIKENQKFLDDINQYCNIFDKSYKKLHILRSILAKKNFLIVQTYKYRRGLNEAIKNDTKKKIEINDPLSVEDLKKEITEKIKKNELLNLKGIYYSIPLIFVRFYEKGEKLVYLSPLEIINFLFLLLEKDDDKNDLNSFLKDKIDLFLDEEMESLNKENENSSNINNLQNDNQDKSNNQNDEESYSNFAIKNEFEMLNNLISKWKEKIEKNPYDMHLLEFNICFSNYLSYTSDKLKIKQGISVLEYIQIALLNFVNEFIRNKLKEYGETSKGLVSSTQPLFKNLRRLAEISEKTKDKEEKEKLNNFLNFIYLLLISPAFYPYYTKEFRKELKNYKLYGREEAILKNLIKEIYNYHGYKKLIYISSRLEKLIQFKL